MGIMGMFVSLNSNKLLSAWRPQYSQGLGMALRALTWLMRLAGTSGDCLVQPCCWEQGQLGQAAQDRVQLGFWKPPVMETQQPVPVFGHPHIPFSQCLNGISCFWVCAHSLWSFPSLLLREVCLLYAPTRYLHTWKRSLFSLMPGNLNGCKTSAVKHLAKSLLPSVFSNPAQGMMLVSGCSASAVNHHWWEDFNSRQCKICCYWGSGKQQWL